MLKALGFVFKLAVFSVLVLIVGNFVHLGGKTISEQVKDQVRTQIAHAERSGLVGKMSNWASGPRKIGREEMITDSADDEIPSSERQKLKALIRELNTSRK